MAEFAVRVQRIREPVVHHPNADRLSIVKINGYDCISAKLDDGSHRYKQGDYVAYIPEGTILPEWLLKRLDMWNGEQNKGLLAGSDGNRVKAIKLRGIFSQGVLFPVKYGESLHCFVYSIETDTGDEMIAVGVWGKPDPAGEDDPDGIDVALLLGITKYEPPIPVAMAGEVCNIDNTTMKYDFENLNSVPDLFQAGDEVIATEKLHGTHAQIGYVPGLHHPDLSGNGNLYIGSKGLSQQGLVMKAGPANEGNVYSRTLAALAADGFVERIAALAAETDGAVHVFGEIYGMGVQGRYSYGTKGPQFRAFDIALNRAFVDNDTFTVLCARLGLQTVPPLYAGPFDRRLLEEHRDGKTLLGGQHIREGLVVKAMDGSYHPVYGRRVAKMVSPAYLLKTDGTEIA